MIKRTILAAACLTSGLIAANATQPPATAPVGVETASAPNLGLLKGRVTDHDNNTLPGASIRIEELGTMAVSDATGTYSIPNLKPGTYTLKITYIGYRPVEKKVTITSRNALQENITMKEDGELLNGIVVNGSFSGERRALQQQKTHLGVANIISADQVGKFPDSNIGDALKRVTGVNVQYDQGEARFGQVRGLAADLTSVTLDGNRIPSAEKGTRNVQLDLIPADMVQTIELNKVVTADMDGDAIGGEINLVTKNTPNHRVLNFTGGTGYSWISDKPEWNLAGTWGDRFFDNHLGMMFSASYQYAPGGSDNVEYNYVRDDDDIKLDKAEVRQYYVTRQRQSYSAAFDYTFNPNHQLSFKAIYNRRHDWENRYRVSYKSMTKSEKKQKIVMQTKAGDSDEDRNARLELQQTLDLNLTGKHNLGILGTEWGITFSRASEDRPNERYFGVVLKAPLSSTFQDVGLRHPYSTFQIPPLDNGDWSIDELTNGNEKVFENEWKAKLNFHLPLGNGGEYGNLKFGGKYAAKDKHNTTHTYDYADSFDDDWTQHLTTKVRSGFMPGSQFPIHSQFVDRKYLANIDFSKLQGKEVYEDAAGNYTATEKIASAYLRYDKIIAKRHQIVAGLRMENTHISYNGLNWIVDADDNESLVPTGKHKNSYTDWLPSVLYKWDASKNLKLRASFTKTLARPKYSDLVPSVSYSVSDEKATIGNENLKPTTSYNFDASVEYYFKQVGLASVNFFYKNIKDVIVTEQWKGTARELPQTVQDYEVSKPVNGYDASVVGVEVSYERDFSFIAPALRCLGLYANYTYTHSSTRNYKFEHRIVADGEKLDMNGSPAHTANASLYFDKWGFNMRLSYNYASSFVDELGSETALDRYYDHVSYLDLNLGYTFGKSVKYNIYASANNLLNQPLRYYQGHRNRTMQEEYYGVRVNCGIKINF